MGTTTRKGIRALAAMACVLGMVAAQAIAGGGFDSDFSGNGKVTTDLTGSEDLSAVVTKGNRAIFAGGHTDLFGDDDFSVSRYRGIGTLDEGYAAGGHAITGFSGTDQVYDLALDRKGRAVAVGVADLGGDPDVAIARYRAGGGLDPGFSDDGKLTLAVGGDAYGFGVAIQKNGKIVIAVRTVGLSRDFVLARLNPDGTPDDSFDDNGFLVTDFGGDEFANALVLQGRKIVVAGSSDAAGEQNFAIARYRSNGVLDDGFSGTGRQLVDFGDDATATSVATAPNGRLVVAGFAGTGSGDWALARLRRDGGLDGGFAGDGLRVTDPGGTGDSLQAVATPGKRIVVAGETNASGGRRFAIGRYGAAGGLDDSFAGDGIKSFTVRQGAQSEGARDMAVQPNGRIVAAGFTFDGQGDQALVRLRPGDR